MTFVSLKTTNCTFKHQKPEKNTVDTNEPELSRGMIQPVNVEISDNWEANPERLTVETIQHTVCWATGAGRRHTELMQWVKRSKPCCVTEQGGV